MIAAVEHIGLFKSYITMTWHQKAKVNYMTKLMCGFFNIHWTLPVVNIYSSISVMISSIRDVLRLLPVEPKAFSIRSCFFFWIAIILSSTESLTMNCRT